MKRSEFRIGETFWCGGQKWRCTDIGTRTVIAICLSRVDVASLTGSTRSQQSLNETDAAAEGWFNGPPYAVAEHVFDEDGVAGCHVSAAGLASRAD